MAVLGRWTGGSVAIVPTTSWAAPASLFPTEARNDTSAYSFAAASSTLTLPSSGLADGYLLVGRFEFEDTSNGRCNPQGRFTQASGSGTFVSGATGGFNRDTSEDRSYVSTWAFVDGPSASSTYQFQWRRDADSPTGGTVRSSFDVIPFYYSDIGLYSSTSTTATGGTTPTQVTGFTGTDGSNITLSSNVVTVAGDNKRYLVLGSQFFDGLSSTRTQRWHGLRIDGTKEDAAKGYSYYRDASNNQSGEMFTWLLETSTADVTIDQFVYRGDGVTAGQGGANIDGSTAAAAGDHALVVIELNDSAEVFRSVDGTGGVDLNVTGPVDQVIARTGDIDFNDSASFTRSTDTAFNVEDDMDALIGANVSAAQEVVATTSRWTAHAEITVNGTEDTSVFAGDYCRNSQGGQSTFGWSANVLGFVGLSSGDDVGVSIQELSGGEDGGQLEVQPGWTGFWGVNLDTLEGAGGGSPITVDVPVGSVAYTGQVPTVSTSSNTAVTVPVGSVSYTGQAPSVVIQVPGYMPGKVWMRGISGGLSPFLTLNKPIAWSVDADPVSVEVPTGSVSYAGQIPVVSVSDNQSVTVPTGSVSYTGQVPSVALGDNQTVAVPVGSVTYSGQAPTITVSDNQAVTIPVGSVSYSGQTPTVIATDNQVVEVPLGGITYAGQVPTVVATDHQVVEIPTASVTYTGFAPVFSAGDSQVVSPGTAAIVYEGQVPTVIAAVSVEIPAGAVSYTGQVPTVSVSENVAVTVPTGTVSYSGQVPTVIASGSIPEVLTKGLDGSEVEHNDDEAILAVLNEFMRMVA